MFVLDEKELHVIRNDAERNNEFQRQIRGRDAEFGKACDAGDIVTAFETLCKNMDIQLEQEQFLYSLDFNYIMDITIGYRYGNLTPDYDTFLHSSLTDMKISNSQNAGFESDYNRILDAIIGLTKRICILLEERKPSNYLEKIDWFANMENGSACTFKEAIQRILFLNQLMWQSDHRLVGLGNIDCLLAPWYEKEVGEPDIRKEYYSDLRDMVRILHKNFYYKSNMLLGDTGQIFVLGKSNEKGEYIYNDITLHLINIIRELQFPDPKILLRVNSQTPSEVWECAIKCMATGVGTPLISNDNVVIKRLVEFGFPLEDAVNYVTAACWEPLICGKSASLNNMTTLNYMKGLDYLFRRENLTKITSFEEFFKRYLENLARNLNAVKRVVKNARFQYNPILSVFMKGCKEKRRDVSQGGAFYAHAGITTVGLSNVVNSLLNIQKYVFEEKKYTLLDVKKMVLLDFQNCKDLCTDLKKQSLRYGCDDERVIQLTNRILRFTSEQTKNFLTYQGGKIKFGVSAPTYIDAAKSFDASFDGRRQGEPFGVHISNDRANSYTEIFNFAAALDYAENRFNGNVIDVMTSPQFMADNMEKFTYMLKKAVDKGIFQLQINVVSSDTLIKAKENPEMYPHLIVRVWGFSAYFNDLPEEYQNLLIKRASENEQMERT